MFKPLMMCVVFAVSASMFLACSAPRPRSAPAATATATVPVAAPVEAGRSVGAEPEVRDMNLRPIPGVKEIHFAYDSDGLDESARAVLRANAAVLKARPAMKVQVGGHCDQRGTVAYNLALGQRRAAAVRSYYKSLGVAPERVATISWGKEHLLCSDATEACWERNRRAETQEAVDAKVATP
ncbi:MAG: OmpA family protein [Elusimicrobia bacterium]|nr:OmpA family protein [Elusimicrobiota bacterium]